MSFQSYYLIQILWVMAVRLVNSVEHLLCLLSIGVIIVNFSGHDYEICPYATFNLADASQQNPSRDYSMHFRSFNQQECFQGMCILSSISD